MAGLFLPRDSSSVPVFYSSTQEVERRNISVPTGLRFSLRFLSQAIMQLSSLFYKCDIYEALTLNMYISGIER